jgi:hypothetical protein
MKASARPVLLVLAGLSLTGCVSQTATRKVPPKPQAVALGDQPLSSRDHWLLRDMEDRHDRALLGGQTGGSPGR